MVGGQFDRSFVESCEEALRKADLTHGETFALEVGPKRVGVGVEGQRSDFQLNKTWRS